VFTLYLYLAISTCFGLLWAHHQEIQLYLLTLGTCFSVWMSVWYAGYAYLFPTIRINLYKCNNLVIGNDGIIVVSVSQATNF